MSSSSPMGKPSGAKVGIEEVFVQPLAVLGAAGLVFSGLFRLIGHQAELVGHGASSRQRGRLSL